MRITGGRFRGRNLHSFEGREIRPTGSRTREAAFHLLGDIDGTAGLDLFCGAGTFALEAISRGARFVVLVDRSPTALRIARKNVAMLDARDHARLVRRDLARGLPGSAVELGPFDWAFLDPPYALTEGSAREGLLGAVLASLAEPGWLTSDAIVLLEHRGGRLVADVPPPFRVVDLRRYGEAGLALLRSEASPPSEGAK